MKIIIIIYLFLIAHFSFAQMEHSYFDVFLSAKKFPLTEIKDTTIVKRYTHKPFIRVFLPEQNKTTGRAIVICPGGGYGILASGHEGYSWAKFYNNLGIAAIVLKYRLPYGNYNIPISDAKEALQIVKDSASNWSINPNDIGIMGFSAGGHLASTIATQAKKSFIPKFQILFYPVITMDKKYTHIGSHNNLIGKNASIELETLYSNEKQVTIDSPPALIILAADDKVVSPANGIHYFEALNSHNVHASLHIYPSGNHGWGFNKKYKYNQVILNELTQWLNTIDIK